MSDKVSCHVIPADLLRHGSGLMGPKVDNGDWVLFKPCSKREGVQKSKLSILSMPKAGYFRIFIYYIIQYIFPDAYMLH